MPGAVDPELYTRWVQFGAFSPILRTHTAKNPDSERRLWAYPEPYSAILRSTFQLRYSRQPYIYTEARRTYDTGTAFLHPLYYEYPEASEAYSSKDEYFFGDSMIVSPIVHPVDSTTQLAKQAIWIPKGDWIEWPSGKHLIGPANVERSFSISQEPIYLRAGAIIPMQPPMQYTGEKPVDPLILMVWPLSNGQYSSYTLYEDGSDSELYKQGIYALTQISAKQREGTLFVDVAPVQGSYPGMQRSRGYELRLPDDWPPQSVTVNGQSLSLEPSDSSQPGWHYDGNTLSTIVHLSSHPVSEAIHIEVHRGSDSMAVRGDLDGFAGAIARLRSAYDTLNQDWPSIWSPDFLIDAWQTGDRISYRPETAGSELSHFAQNYAAAQASVQRLLDSVVDQSSDPQSAKSRGSDRSPEQTKKLKISLDRALAQLKDGEPDQP
jgi:alpha-glucosidase